MTLKLEYGKTYVNGRGEQRGPMEPHSYPALNEAGYTFRCPKGGHTFTESGVFYLVDPGDSDLVAEYCPPGGLKLEYGKTYVNGWGEQRGPMTTNPNRVGRLKGYTFLCPRTNLSFTENGVFCISETSESDIVAEYTPPVVEEPVKDEEEETPEYAPCFCPGCISDRLAEDNTLPDPPSQIELDIKPVEFQVELRLTRSDKLAILWIATCAAFVGALVAQFAAILLM